LRAAWVDTNANTYSYGHSYSHAYAYTHSYANLYAESYSVARAASHSACSANNWRVAALEDADLQPIWDSI
jgi:hypothetical protein